MANYVGSSGGGAKRGGGSGKWIFALVALAVLGAGAWFLYPVIEEKLLTARTDIEHLGNNIGGQGVSDSPPDVVDAVASATTKKVQSKEDDDIAKVLAVLAEVEVLKKADKLVETRDKLLGLMKTPQVLGASRAAVEELLGDVNVELIMSRRGMPGKVNYSVQEGDTLGSIVNQFVCPKLHIMKMNNIQDENRIRPGDVLRVMDHPKYEIEINKTDNTLVLTFNGEFFKRYKVGTGEFGTTPVGTFVIDDKIENPPWWKDGKAIPFGDKENILGTRWMRISATEDTTPVSGYGIHGTWDDTTLGKQSSAGCIRMSNPDVEEVFMLVPRGTPVRITE